MLLCDGCDAGCHLKCAGLRRVPKGDWFCGACEGAKKEAGRKRKADRPAVGNRERGR